MKTAFTFLFLNLGLCLGENAFHAQTDSTSVLNGARISVNKETHDYGTIKLNSNGNCEFIITNTGNEPLIIRTVNASCSCMVPTWSMEPIAPGKIGFIKLKYDTNRPGPINKSVTITSNAIDEPKKVLRIAGNILPDQNITIPATNPASN